MPQADRLAEARAMLDRPETLASEFAASVERFSAYDNAAEPFYPETRAQRTAAAVVRRTNGVILPLERQGALLPADAHDRLVDHDAGAGVAAVVAADLACEYVARELG